MERNTLQRMQGKNTYQEQLTELNQYYQKQSAVFHEFAVRAGLSDTVFWLFYVLCEAGEPYTQNRFCEEWYYPKQTVNSALNGMVKKGYITLEVIAGTRNSKQILLTEQGEVFCTQYIRPALEADRNAFGRLTGEERTLYLQLVRKQLGYLEQELKRLEQ